MSLNGAQRRPLVVEVENLHWIDPTSEEVLGALVERLAGARILLLLTYRPGYRPLWMDKSYATQLALTPLDHQDSRRVVRALMGTRVLPEPTLEAMVTRADGNPLFLEELAHTVAEWADPSQPSVVPATLQAVLAARIDRLGPDAKRLLQVAAVIGKDIPLPLLQAVVKMPEGVFQRHLHHLQTAELLYETTWVTTPTLTFKHVLIQEAAYQSLLEEARQQVHRQIAQMLVERFPDTAERRPEMLASHYMAAGLRQHAVVYWQRAGERAIKHSAYLEAIAHLTQGIAVLDSLPPTRERLQQELALQTALGSVLIVAKGYTAPEVEHAYLRAQELCQQLGETPQHFPVLFGLGVFYLVRAQYQTVHTLAEQLLLLAQRRADTSLHLEAHGLFGVNYYCRGAMVQAREHFEQVLTYYDDSHAPHPHTFAYGREPGIACQAYLALILWWLGYPEQAATRSQLALARAHALAHPATLVYVASFAARLHQQRHEVAQTQACLETVRTLAAEHGFPFWAARATILHGWVLTAQGHAEAGIAAIRQGIDACRAIGAAQWEPSWLALLAEAYKQAGQAHAGLAVLAEALEHVRQSGEHTEEAELYRLQGELLLLHATQQGKRDLITEATRCFHHARELAQRQGAKMWELRAVLSLCRLLQTQGQGAAAQHLLADTYRWFREGFDTRDLQAAKTLLAGL